MYNLILPSNMDILPNPSPISSRRETEKSMTSEVNIRLASEDLDREECYHLRRSVFVYEQGFPSESEQDDYDVCASQYLVIYKGRPMGTVRLVDKGDGVGKIGKLAILPEYRGNGIGSDLMWYVMGAGFRHFHTLILDSTIECIPFFEKLGFETDGEMMPIYGKWHMRMLIRR